MKKTLGFIVALILMITLLPLHQAEASTVNQHYTVNVAKLDVREKPSSKARIVGALKKNTAVFVYNTESGGWSKIKYNGKAGYIASKNLMAKVNYSMNKYGVIKANYSAGDTIILKVGQKLAVNRTDKLNRDDYHDRIMTSYGPVDFTDDAHIIGREAGFSELTIIPFSYNWEDAYVIYIEVYK